MYNLTILQIFKSETKFDEADLCFASNIGTNLFNKILTSNRQLHSEESDNLPDSETEADLTNLEKGLYSLAKRQIQVLTNESLLNKHDHEQEFAFSLAKVNWIKIIEYLGIKCIIAPKGITMNDNQIYILDIIGKYSHPMSNNIEITASHHWHFISKMWNNIKLFAASGMCTRAVIDVLTHKYPDQYIYAHSVYNIVQIIKAEKRKLIDADTTYKELICQKQEEPGWYVDHLMRKSQFVRLNETIRELLHISHASYQDYYFKAIDNAYTKFLTPNTEVVAESNRPMSPLLSSSYRLGA
ncbi:42982_t:CDS:2 [Gigaspora margarita]|uniref:42982_t:CDS:1 n=1 Tax=Gigaspora margarita TaxID=4874 RepID=A0ABN7W500_GIGMA|nr:42982_t:CDS:2 [Gigaspora margarita]